MTSENPCVLCQKKQKCCLDIYLLPTTTIDVIPLEKVHAEYPFIIPTGRYKYVPTIDGFDTWVETFDCTEFNLTTGQCGRHHLRRPYFCLAAGIINQPNKDCLLWQQEHPTPPPATLGQRLKSVFHH